MKNILLIFIVSSFSFTLSAQVPEIDTNYIGFSNWRLAEETGLYNYLQDSFSAKLVYNSNQTYEYIKFEKMVDSRPSRMERTIYLFDKKNKLIKKTVSLIESQEFETEPLSNVCYKYDKQNRLLQERISEISTKTEFINYIYYGNTNNIEWKIYSEIENAKPEFVQSKIQFFYDNLNRKTDWIRYEFSQEQEQILPRFRKTFNYKGYENLPVSSNKYYYNNTAKNWELNVQINGANELQGLPKHADLSAERNYIRTRGCCSRSIYLTNIYAELDAQSRPIKTTERWEYSGGDLQSIVHNSNLLYTIDNKLKYYEMTRSFINENERKSKLNFYYSNNNKDLHLIRQPNLSLKVFPTNAFNRINIELTQNTNTESTIVIRNVAGNIIKILDKITAPQHTEIIEITNFLPGNYTCTVITKDGSAKTERFVVVK